MISISGRVAFVALLALLSAFMLASFTQTGRSALKLPQPSVNRVTQRYTHFHKTLSRPHMTHQPKVLSKEDLSPADAKWVTLRKIHWSDPQGKERLWESAERTTRGSSGVDAVAILAILRSETNAFPTSTVIIEQYRPPVNSFVVELPAGLIDEGETAEQAAIRELEEETGYKAQKIIESSPVVVADPGMTNANMKLVIVDVPFPDQLETYDQKLDAGEFITRRVVELSKLSEEFKEYERKGFTIDAKLAHFAYGYDAAKKLQGNQL